MSSFGGNNWWQSLQGLFGGNQGQGPRGPAGGAANTGWVNWQGMPTLGSPYFDPNKPSELRSRTIYRAGEQPGGGMTYGQALVGALGKDYANAEAARQKELAMYQGLFGNLMNSMQGAGQMVGDARQMGQQNMQMMQGQADAIRRAAGEGQRYYDDAQRQMMSGLAEARRRMDQGIGTLQAARSSYDATNRSDTAGEVFGIQSQYKNQLDQISRRDDLTQEQKDMMTNEVKQGMHQHSSALAAQADAKARDTLLALDQNIAQMQSSTGAQLGQFGIGIGQTLGQLGLQVSAQKQQAEEQIGSFYNNMAQFNSSMIQSAQANALQYVLNGNQAAANLINAMPLGPMSIFETLTRMVSAGDFRRNQQVSPEMGALFGRLG